MIIISDSFDELLRLDDVSHTFVGLRDHQTRAGYRSRWTATQKSSSNREERSPEH